jgi:hypothetical protein
MYDDVVLYFVLMGCVVLEKYRDDADICRIFRPFYSLLFALFTFCLPGERKSCGQVLFTLNWFSLDCLFDTVSGEERQEKDKSGLFLKDFRWS